MRVPDLRPVAKGLATGTLVAILAAAIPTALDWYRNWSGLFRNDSGTNWSIVFETWLSWFWPLALVAIPCAVVAHMIMRRRGITKDS